MSPRHTHWRSGPWPRCVSRICGGWRRASTNNVPHWGGVSHAVRTARRAALAAGCSTRLAVQRM
eukprot:1123960-Prymnesium_polylepis.1